MEDLRRKLDVSVATIRRDLEILEEDGKVRRVHGGAVSMESRLEEPVFENKTSSGSKGKTTHCRGSLLPDRIRTKQSI